MKLKNYFGDHTPSTEHGSNATELLRRVDLLVAAGMPTFFEKGSEIRDGYRLPDCPYGAKNSTHKTGEGVDLNDRQGKMKEWLYKNAHLLEKFDLYMEIGSMTPTWVHLQTRPTKRRMFYP